MFKSLEEAKAAYYIFQDLESSVEQGAEILNKIYRKYKDDRGSRFDGCHMDDIDWELGEASLRMTWYDSCGGSDEWYFTFPLAYLGMSEDEMLAVYLKQKEEAEQRKKMDTLIAEDAEVAAGGSIEE